jgi:hypothetical protein
MLLRFAFNFAILGPLFPARCCHNTISSSSPCHVPVQYVQHCGRVDLLSFASGLSGVLEGVEGSAYTCRRFPGRLGCFL